MLGHSTRWRGSRLIQGSKALDDGALQGDGSVVLLLFWCGGIFQLLLTAKEGAGRRVRVISTINATLVPLVLSQGVVQALSGPASSWLSRPGAQWLSLLLLGLLASAPLLMIWLYTSGVARQPHPFLAPAD